jgi:5-methylcytosine-specific restriction endonuclease McrA
VQRTQRANSLSEIAEALAQGNKRAAEDKARRDFSWKASETKRVGIPAAQALKVFLRDRFVDRYSGSRLVFPGALLAVGRLLPQCFPIHPTWKAGQSHDIFWELWPVVDHVHPVARGGPHDEANFVTTSTFNNVAKGNALLSEIGWLLLPCPGPEETWDGLIGWFRLITGAHGELLSDRQIKAGNNALRKVAF